MVQLPSRFPLAGEEGKVWVRGGLFGAGGNKQIVKQAPSVTSSPSAQLTCLGCSNLHLFLGLVFHGPG